MTRLTAACGVHRAWLRGHDTGRDRGSGWHLASDLLLFLKSKEDVLLAQDGSEFAQALCITMLEKSADQAPVEPAWECIIKLATRYETRESIVVNRLLRSTEALRTRKEALFVEMGRPLADTMAKL